MREHFARHRFGNATMHDLFAAWEDAGAGDLSAWTQGWLRTASLDLIALDRSGDTPVLVRSTPAEHPADRSHAMSVARYDDGAGWVVEPVTVGAEPVALSPASAGRPVVLDPRDQTWARLTLDELTLAAMPDLLPGLDDPVMRASVWNAVRDGVSNATVDPEAALRLVEAGIPHETQDIGVAALSSFAVGTLADKLLPDPEAARARFHAAALRRVESAQESSGVQLAAVRGAVASAADPELLRRWLAGDVPAPGVEVDLDLRWRILVRLATLGAVGRTELDAAFDAEPSAKAAVDRVQAVASLPDAEAKEFAWSHFTGDTKASNYAIEAAGTGLWRRGQEELTAPYVDRYFAELPGIATVHSGWVLADAAREFFPRLAVDPATLTGAERVLADDGLDLSLRRAVVDCADELRRAVRSREAFWR